MSNTEKLAANDDCKLDQKEELNSLAILCSTIASNYCNVAADIIEAINGDKDLSKAKDDALRKIKAREIFRG